MKRRPKTAGSTVKRAEPVPDITVHSTPLKPRRNSIGNLSKKADSPKKQSVPAKEAFSGRGEKELSDSSKEKQDSGFCGSRKSASVVSCKSRIETETRAAGARPYSYCQNENTRDGKANWRQTPLIKTKYCLNNSNIVARVTSNTSVNFQTTTEPAPTTTPLTETTNTTRRGYSSNGIQWPLLRHAGSSRSIPTARTAEQQDKASYKWRQELYRTKLSLNKTNTPVYKRNISFPEQIYRPQFRTYSFR